MDCPKCKNSQYCKDGNTGGRQRYKCKRCNYRYTVARKSDVKTQDTRRMALQLYLEGLGFRAIGRILKISYGTVYKWIKAWGEQASLPQKQEPVDKVEIDEIHTYVGSKKNTVGFGLLLIDLEKSSSLLSAGIDRQKQA